MASDPTPSPTTPATRPRRSTVLAALAPGALAGGHLAILLFFLNPELPLRPLPVARALLLYGGLASLGGALVLAPWWLRRPASYLRGLPWLVVTIMGAAALGMAVHASSYAFFLPAGINERLIKASLWITGFTLIAFYTALLHSLNRRRYGIRSRVGLVVLALLSLAMAVERRSAYEPRQEDRRPVRVEANARPRLLVVGVDSASLDALLPMAEEGRLPFLSSSLEAGAYGRLATFEPRLPEALWTTVATGKLPWRHGVLGAPRHSAGLVAAGSEVRLLPRLPGFARWGLLGSPSIDPTPASERRAVALWQTLPRVGAGTAVVGWPATSPPDPEPAVVVSDAFFTSRPRPTEVRPRELAERARIFRLPVTELDPRTLDRLPEDTPPEVLEALAQDLWRGGFVEFVLQGGDADALFLHLPGLEVADALSFGGYADVRFEQRRTEETERATAILGAYATALDGLLERLWQRLPEPRLMVVVSAWGVREPGWWEQARAALTGGPTTGGSLRGAPDGMLLLRGTGVRPGSLITGARLSDVTPTLLYALGLPVARDLEGRVLAEAFERELLERRPLSFVSSYQGLEGDPAALRLRPGRGDPPLGAVSPPGVPGSIPPEPAGADAPLSGRVRP